jgi:TonB family protein
MNSLSDDIIKYKKGELSPEKMHLLEKRALSDPFLAEALEGVDSLTPDQLQNDVMELNQKFLNKNRMTIFTPLRIAAGVVLVAVSVFAVYQLAPKPEIIALHIDKPKVGNKIDENKQMKAKGEAEIKKIESPKLDVQNNLRKSESSGLSASGHRALSPGRNSKSSIEQPVSKSHELPQQAAVQGVAPMEAQHRAHLKIAEKEPTVGPEVADESNPIETDKKKESLSSLQARSANAHKFSAAKSISGHVVSAEDGSPLPGVNVVIKGSAEGTITDDNGDYVIREVEDNQSLIFSLIGMRSEELVAKGNQLDIQMKEDASQLSEVVVTGFAKQKVEDAESVVKLATPFGGRRIYDKYLESNLRYPPEALENNVKGRVTVEFNVGTDGSLNNFNVIKNLGHGCDEEIIRLVKDGPHWSPTMKGNTPVESTVRLQVKFDPANAKR